MKAVHFPEWGVEIFRAMKEQWESHARERVLQMVRCISTNDTKDSEGSKKSSPTKGDSALGKKKNFHRYLDSMWIILRNRINNFNIRLPPSNTNKRWKIRKNASDSCENTLAFLFSRAKTYTEKEKSYEGAKLSAMTLSSQRHLTRHFSVVHPIKRER